MEDSTEEMIGMQVKSVAGAGLTMNVSDTACSRCRWGKKRLLCSVFGE